MRYNGLVIGRFQLVGDQHVDLFDQIVEYHNDTQKLDGLYVGVGVSGMVDGKNPFSGTECLEMISPVAEHAAKSMDVPLHYRLINDINDPSGYADHVSAIFGLDGKDTNIVFSSNGYTNACFEGRPGYRVVETEERLSQHSTQLRKLYASGTDISDLVPGHVPGYLLAHDAKARIEKLMYDNPVPTVDLVVEHEGGIVIINRAETPTGLALPGGHIDYGESAENAAMREGKEETGLDIELTRLIGVFSAPDRDERGHKISIAYAAKGYGELKAGSDAEEAFIDYDPRNLLFDHDNILEEWRKHEV